MLRMLLPDESGFYPFLLGILLIPILTKRLQCIGINRLNRATTRAGV